MTAQRLGWLLALGLLLVALGFIVQNDLIPMVPAVFWNAFVQFGASVLTESGIAVLIAFVLAVTIDRLFRQEGITDVVATALGYLLPAELKEEMLWIYRQMFMAQETLVGVELQLNPDGTTVTMTVDMQRMFENVTADEQVLALGAAVDEWELGDPTTFESFTYRIGGHPWQTRDVQSARLDKYVLVLPPLDVVVPPGGKVESHIRHRENKRPNDQMLGRFAFCTQNPRVTVSISAGLEYEVTFGHRAQGSLPGDPAGGYRLDGTLLPEQPITVRWWPAVVATSRTDG